MPAQSPSEAKFDPNAHHPTPPARRSLRPERDFLIGIRQGALTLQQFEAEATRLREEAESAAASSHLPAETSGKAISALVAEVTQGFWGGIADAKPTQ